MAEDLLTFPGALLRISHVTQAATAPTITASKAYLAALDDGTLLVNGAAGGFSNAAETGKSEYYYDWTPPATWFTDHPTSSGDFVYRLGRLIGTEWQYQSGAILLWPFFSKFDRYIQRVKDWVAESEEGEALQLASQRDYRNALLSALDVYNDDAEPDTAYALTHTADDLPGGIFQSLTEYAAGVLLAGPLANAAAHTMERQSEASVVSFRDIQTRRRQQGMDHMKRARARWADGGLQTGRIVTSTPNEYLDSFRPSWRTLDEVVVD